MPHTQYRVSRLAQALPAGGLLLTLIAAALMSAPSFAASGPFAGFSGSWSGTGTLRPSDAPAERIRCNATYRPRGSSEHQIDLQLRCVSDTYNFDLVGQFSADANDQIAGQWTERSRNVGGTAVGNGRGGRLQLHIESSGFAATMVMLTRNRRQSVNIDSQGGGRTMRASITLSRS